MRAALAACRTTFRAYDWSMPNGVLLFASESEKEQHLIDLQDYGWRGDPDPSVGRISAVHRGGYETVCAQGVVFAVCKASEYRNGAQPIPAVGDYVRLRYNDAGDSLITETLPRQSAFFRLDPSSRGHAAQAVAANMDVVFAVTSMNRDYNEKRLERYLTLALQSGAKPAIILTKLDLCTAPDTFYTRACAIAKDVPVHMISAATGEGMETLEPYLQKGHTVALLGSSGVGKSSLVNALLGNARMHVSSVREDDQRGRHTTTGRQLLRLPGGALVIDTPGMRELGLWDAEQGLSDTFRDIELLAADCRFSDCRHENEPGCAVRQAIMEGRLDAARLHSYLQLIKEAARKAEHFHYKRR